MKQFEMDPSRKVCCICESADIRSFTAAAYDAEVPGAQVNIKECKHCSFAWQFPLARTEAESSEVFTAAYKNAKTTESSYFNPESKRAIAQLEFEFVQTLPTLNPTVLDIGAGSGVFSKLASDQGWRVTAVDPAMDPARFAHHPNIRAVRGTLEQLQDHECFDVVTLWDVIEHVPDPLALLNQASQRLKPGGWLVLETGNYKSADRIELGAAHWIFQLDHRWYFAPDSLKALCLSTGFSEFTFSDRVLRPNWKGKRDFSGPSALQLFKDTLKDPLHLPHHMSKHSALQSAKSWDRAGLGIFAMAARKT